MTKPKPGEPGSASGPKDQQMPGPGERNGTEAVSIETGLSHLQPACRELQRIPRILLIRLRSLGDAILTLPLVEALHAWRPEFELDVLIEAPFAPVFMNHPAIHEVLAVKRRGGHETAGWSRYHAAIEIRKRRYPAVLNLHGGTTSMLFTCAAGAKLRIGQESHRGSRLYNARIPPSTAIWRRSSIHTAEHQLSFMRWFEIPMPEKITGAIHVDKASEARIRDRLDCAGIGKYLVIQPTATLATKQWSAAKFAELGDRLFRQHGVPVLYTAGLQEDGVLREVRRSALERHIYWSDLPLSELFALIKGCLIFIGNDSGPTHAAAAMKRPVVVIWGSSDFDAWHPWGTDYEAVRSEFPCMPCPGYQCGAFGQPRCILDISVQQVIEASGRLMARLPKNIG